MKGCIVEQKNDYYESDIFQFCEYSPDDIRAVVNSAGRVNLDTLIIDLDVAPAAEILTALHSYRIQRPDTRIIILAPLRQPGDKAVAGMIALGIYDIVAPEDNQDVIPDLQRLLIKQPATYAQAARWAIQFDEEPQKVKKKFWDRDREKDITEIVDEPKPKKRLWGKNKEAPISKDEIDTPEGTCIPEVYPDQEMLLKIISELEKITAHPNISNGQLAAVSESVSVASSNISAVLSITYHTIKTIISALLFIMLLLAVVIIIGQIASLFPEKNNVSLFFIELSNQIKDLF